MTAEPAWLTAICRKRPEVALLVHALIVAGLRQGVVTAEDAHNIPVSHPNTRGAAMRYLRHAGFSKDTTPIYGTTRQSHHHVMFRWILRDTDRAKNTVRALAATVVHLQVMKAQPDLPGM